MANLNLLDLLDDGFDYPTAVRAILDRKGDTVSSFAEKYGINRSTVSAELGTRRGSYPTIRKLIAAYCDVDSSELDRRLEREAGDA